MFRASWPEALPMANAKRRTRDAERGYFAENLLHFGRLLRSMGLKVSTNQIVELGRALELIDISRRDDFYHTARGFFTTCPDDIEPYDKAFELFWLGMRSWMLEFGQTRHLRKAEGQEDLPESNESVLDPDASGNTSDENNEEDEQNTPQADEDIRLNALYSAVEVLQHKNFAAFTEAERELAKRALHMLVLNFKERLTRRLRRTNKRGRYLDLRRSIRTNISRSGEIIELKWLRRKTKPRPLVVICDISGSMDQYSRMFLHFIHTLCQGVQEVEVFAFGTRLTRLTPALRHHDIDAAIDEVSELVVDWSGGTRIGQSLKMFNYQWSRRVLGRGAVVLVISDGWERGDMDTLRREIDRLSRSAYRLMWLNPLAGTPGYEPRVMGIQTIMPYCDDFMPLQNLQSFDDLIHKLGSVMV